MLNFYLIRFFSEDVDSLQSPTDAIQYYDNFLYVGEGWGGVKIFNIEDK